MPVDAATRRKILRANADYARQVKRIQQDPYLSPEGKRRALAVLYHQHRAYVTSERQRSDERARQRAERLRRHLFAPPPGAILEWRDAVDRLGDVSSVQKMQGMLRTARTVGDTSMIRAILAAAWQRAATDTMGRGWSAVVEEAVQAAGPDLRPYADELAAIERADTREARFTEAAEFGVLRPPELDGVSDMEVARIAAEADRQGGAA